MEQVESEGKVNIEGLDKAKVLMALYEGSRPLGLGFLQEARVTPGWLTHEKATEMLGEQTYYDYLAGRVMKVNLKSDTEFGSRLYDRDNGDGAAARVIEALRGK